MPEISRREFVAAAAVAACACAFCPSCLLAVTGPAGPVDAGELKDFAQDGVIDRFALTQRFLLIRQEGRLYAVSAVCTHKGSTVLPEKATGALRCPKHGSEYTLAGTVSKGPATRPLSRLGISVNDQKHVMVDPTKQFDEGHWDEAGSFVKVE